MCTRAQSMEAICIHVPKCETGKFCYHMTSQLNSEIVTNRAEAVLDFSQLGKGYMRTPLGRKLAQAGISVSNLAERSQTSRADVSHYIHGRKHKIGRARRKRIFNVLCELGLVKRKVRRAPLCKNCGVQYPTRVLEQQPKRA